ncbi:MAG: hypothetical protein B7X54_01495 [Idiomarina sp. 34-48-12]|nr:MAG: hypothetical protein B7X54_01495 [Idiomarina sp. 34-48-12]
MGGSLLNLVASLACDVKLRLLISWAGSGVIEAELMFKVETSNIKVTIDVAKIIKATAILVFVLL